MPFTRSYQGSYKKTVATVQRLGQEVASMIGQLGDYLKGLVTSQDPDWMGRVKEFIRWILEKMMEFYHRIRYSLANYKGKGLTKASSSAREEILKAVETTKQWATDLMYGVRASIYEVLEAVKAKILELKTKEEAVKEEETDEYDAEEEDSEDEGPPAAKRIKIE